MSIKKNSYVTSNEFDLKRNRRYSQIRTWGTIRNKATIIMYNPRNPDPNPIFHSLSIEKCVEALIRYDNNFGSIEVVNLFADCSSNSKDLNKGFRKFDETNFGYITKAVMDNNTSVVILAWGKNYVAPMSRNERFVNLITGCNKKLMCLGLYDNHQPMHPANRKVLPKLYPCKMIECKGNQNGNIYLYH
ncbi:DUF1643 domain-containing protein [Lysinibacillus fusiformis]|uniref:DUF1643 domain-containing protein n=1 Tax=Lysinibacillus fusiformis TaxID=28031 RepID=UPI001966DF87|nr:DUF1643 domain-containing protein [Lysinibacillus fusiformis]QSB10849.1 DUF1643 domain-containing protein [Lysinibacillus fusiformis]